MHNQLVHTISCTCVKLTYADNRLVQLLHEIADLAVDVG